MQSGNATSAGGIHPLPLILTAFTLVLGDGGTARFTRGYCQRRRLPPSFTSWSLAGYMPARGAAFRSFMRWHAMVRRV